MGIRDTIRAIIQLPPLIRRLILELLRTQHAFETHTEAVKELNKAINAFNIISIRQDTQIKPSEPEMVTQPQITWSKAERTE